MTEEVHHRVTKRLRELLAYHKATLEEDYTSEEEEPQVHRKKRKELKSGMHCTGATTIVRKVAWLHEVVYTSDGKPAAYQDFSVPLFVQGYLITMGNQDNSVKHRMAEHLNDLISDTEMYGWDRAYAFQNLYEVRPAHGSLQFPIQA